jgi:hypothetical protein
MASAELLTPETERDVQSQHTSCEPRLIELWGNFIVDRIRAGADDDTIIGELVGLRVAREQAELLVSEFRDSLGDIPLDSGTPKRRDVPPLTVAQLTMAIAGASAAALVCGAIWGGIAIAVNLEVGYVAWGIGGICGLTVVQASGGCKGMALQVIAVVASVVGIVLGKFIFLADVLKQDVAEMLGPAAAETVSMFSIEAVHFFQDNFLFTVGLFDLLFFGLAIATAWKIPDAYETN